MYDSTSQLLLNQLTQNYIRGEITVAASEEIAQLSQMINYHDWRYYVLSDPTITDSDYDKLYKRLQSLEELHPLFADSQSPTKRVAKALPEDTPQVPHLVSMLSLENSYDLADINEFNRKVQGFAGNDKIQYCVEPKFDGSSIALVYENDILIRASTRGDGTVGEEITNNARALSSIPHSAPFSKFGISKVELRGEVIIKKNAFLQMNAERKAQGLKTFQNARNTASGSLRMKDPKEVASRGLEAILYHVSYAVNASGESQLGTSIKSHYHSIEILQDCGFKTPIDDLNICNSIEAVDEFLNIWNTKRLDFEIETDGMVIKVNDLAQQQLCGSTAHHPRWAIAYKFAAKQAQSRLLEVEYQVGRTGAITPVAKIEPVALSGVTISSISLHNEDFITEKDIMLGDIVLVERAGEVIPYISGAVADLRDGSERNIVFPTSCPSCGTELVRPIDESIWRCDNAECPAQCEERIIHYVSKDAMDIDGLGRSIIIDFMARGFLKTIEDIYRLPYEEIQLLEGWGLKSIDKLRASIETSKNRPLWRLLVALGIRHVGVGTSKDLSKHIGSIFDLNTKSAEELTNIEGVGPKVASSVTDFFHNESNKRLLEELNILGLNTSYRPEDTIAKNQLLAGKTFLFTGTLARFTRERAKVLVEENGGTLLSGVSSKLSYLVVGADAGSKLAKAKAIPSIVVLTEDEFLTLIASES